MLLAPAPASPPSLPVRSLQLTDCWPSLVIRALRLFPGISVVFWETVFRIQIEVGLRQTWGQKSTPALFRQESIWDPPAHAAAHDRTSDQLYINLGQGLQSFAVQWPLHKGHNDGLMYTRANAYTPMQWCISIRHRESEGPLKQAYQGIHGFADMLRFSPCFPS